MHNSNIYTGNINNNNSIFVPEIMICCKDANELSKFNNKFINEN